MPALMYALGGGWGHLTRAVALARVFPLRILTNSPYAARVAAAMPDLDLIALPADLPVEQARTEAVREIRKSSPSCLLVDTFPRGLGGELADVIDTLAPANVLVHRDLDPSYVDAAQLRDFVRRHYDLVLAPGEGDAFDSAIATGPWIIPVVGKAAQPEFLVAASGTADELPWYGEVAAGLQARCVAPVCPPGCPSELWIDHWPAVDLIASASVVVGGAGYNTIYECLAYRTPLVARPWPRKYDRQWLRAQKAAKLGRVRVVQTPEEAVSAAIEELRTARPREAVELCSGVVDAAAILSRFVQQRDDRLKQS